MKRSLPQSETSDTQPTKKTRRMTPSQRSRKRELDREAQRTARAKTKNHISYLENLVQSFRGGNDDRVAELVRQLDEKQAVIQRLQTVMGSIGKLVDSSRTEASSSIVVEDGGSVQREHGILSPMSMHASAVTRREKSVKSPTASTEIVATPDMNAIPILADTVSTPSKSESNVYKPYQKHSIAQTAASIYSNTQLEGRLWYLAGALLNKILNTPSDAPIMTSFDEEIAIRAIFHGWSSVIERFPLDRGWQWLKEVDERIYFHLHEPLRLVHLRHCRLVFLRQSDPEGGWEDLMPPYFRHCSTAEYATHDPLVEYFPWPGFRERLLRSPLKFARDDFNDAIQTHLHVPWNRDPHETYIKDPDTGLFRYSDALKEFVQDLRTYSVAPEFFERFPELRADIPCLDPSP
jgi:hypothetical protein